MCWKNPTSQINGKKLFGRTLIRAKLYFSNGENYNPYLRAFPNSLSQRFGSSMKQGGILCLGLLKPIEK